MNFSPLARVAAVASLIALAASIAACGSSYSGGGGGGSGCGYGGPCPSSPPVATDCSVLAANPVTIDLNLSLAVCNDKTYSNVLAFSIDNAHSQIVKIPVGSNVVFMSGSAAPHSADLLGTAGFPASDTNPETASPVNADISSANFSTGTLNLGISSANYKANVAGIYFFGCHFHYASNGMRTVLIVQ